MMQSSTRTIVCRLESLFLLSLSLQSKGADDGDGASGNDDGDKEEVENERILHHLLDCDHFFTLTKKGVVDRLTHAR